MMMGAAPVVLTIELPVFGFVLLPISLVLV